MLARFEEIRLRGLCLSYNVCEDDDDVVMCRVHCRTITSIM